jgi:probable rRNA maturation factor
MDILEGKNISVRRQTKGKLPRLPFLQLKDAILGKNYELSIAFVGLKRSHEINLTTRGKDKPTNVLSFELSKNEGELVLSLEMIRRDAKNFEMNYSDFTLFLLIHGMLHLKGMDHSSTMEKAENKFFKLFSTT